MKNIMGEANTFTNQMNPNIIHGDENYNEDAICAQVLADRENFNHREVKITPKIIEKAIPKRFRISENTNKIESILKSSNVTIVTEVKAT